MRPFRGLMLAFALWVMPSPGQAVTQSILLYHASNAADPWGFTLGNLNAMLATAGWTVTVIQTPSTYYDPSGDNWNNYDQVWDFRFKNANPGCTNGSGAGTDYDSFGPEWQTMASNFMANCGRLVVLSENRGFRSRNAGNIFYLNALGLISGWEDCAFPDTDGNQVSGGFLSTVTTLPGAPTFPTEFTGGVPLAIMVGGISYSTTNSFPDATNRSNLTYWGPADLQPGLSSALCSTGKLFMSWDMSGFLGPNWPGTTANLTSTYQAVRDLLGSKTCACGTPTFTATVTPTRTITPSRTVTPSSTSTATPSHTPSPSPTFTSTPTRSSTPSSTNTPSPSPTSTSTLTHTSTVTPSHTPSVTPTSTSSPTRTATVSPSHTSSPSFTYTQTVAPSVTPSATPTRTFTVTATSTMTITTLDTATHTSTITPTSTVSPTSSSTSTPTATPSATRTSTETFTITQSATASSTPTATPTSTESMTPSSSSTPSSTSTVTLTATQTATASGTPTPSSTSTATPTSTQTMTPSATSTPSATGTASPSLTATVTASQSSTPSTTPSQTPTSTVTPTRTDTGVFTPTTTPTVTATSTATPSSSATSTPTETPSVTATASASPSATPSATVTVTATVSATATLSVTDSPTSTVSPTVTETSTYTETPVPTPLKLRISIYNSAGERVRVLFDGSAQALPTDLELSAATLVTGNQEVSLDLHGAKVYGTGSLSWDGANDGGQNVSSGNYYFKVETTDAFGSVSAFIQPVQVLNPVADKVIEIYNSAGELVYSQALNGAYAGVSGMRLGADSLAPGVGEGSSAEKLPVYLQTSTGELLWEWDGRNAQGGTVNSGTYLVKLVVLSPGGKRDVQVYDISVLKTEPLAKLGGRVVAGPNPLRGTAPLRVSFSPDPSLSVRVQVYNLAGELVAATRAWGGAGLVELGMPVASGIYFVEVDFLQGASIARRTVQRLAVLH